jgi:hypothetical protein
VNAKALRVPGRYLQTDTHAAQPQIRGTHAQRGFEVGYPETDLAFTGQTWALIQQTIKSHAEGGLLARRSGDGHPAKEWQGDPRRHTAT